jgi:hypothetical protein
MFTYTTSRKIEKQGGSFYKTIFQRGQGAWQQGRALVPPVHVHDTVLDRATLSKMVYEIAPAGQVVILIVQFPF